VMPGACVTEPQLLTGHCFQNRVAHQDWHVGQVFSGNETYHGLLLQPSNHLNDDPPNEPSALEACLGIQASSAVERRVILDLAFVWSDFHGSAVNKKANVCGAVCDAIVSVGAAPPSRRKPLCKSTRWQAISRTDKGVHARSFCLATPVSLAFDDWNPGRDCVQLAAAINAQLPGTVRVLRATGIPCSLNLKSLVRSREYRYYLPRSALSSSGNEGIAALARVLRLFEGTRSFVNFTNIFVANQLKGRRNKHTDFMRRRFNWLKKRREKGFPQGSQVPDIPMEIPMDFHRQSQRTLQRAELLTEDNSSDGLLCVRLVASGFMYHMACLIVGAACAVAAGHLDERILQLALAGEEAVDISEFKATPQGLVLFSQSLDLGTISWLSAPGGVESDAFWTECILPEVRRAWSTEPELFCAVPWVRGRLGRERRSNPSLDHVFIDD